MRKSILIFFSFLFFSFHVSHLPLGFTFDVFAQQPTQEWVRRWPDPSPASSNGKSIKMDSAGNIYVLADTGLGFGFLKYSSTGNLLLTAHHWPGGPYINGFGNFLEITPNGNVYVTGFVAIDFYNWIYTAKFNSSGSFQWGRLYDLHDEDAVSDIKLDDAGNISIVGAALSGNIVYGLILKYNSAGDTLWTRVFSNGQNFTRYNKLVFDNGNNLCITGYVTSPSKALVVRYDTYGNLNWITTFAFDSSTSCIGNGIELDIFGNIYVLGGMAVDNRIHSFLSKLSGTGSILWSRASTLINNGGYGLKGPVISSDGSSVYHTSMPKNGIGGYGIATIKYSSSGDSQWVKFYNGGGVPATGNFPGGINLDRFDNIYVCGTGYFQTTGDDFVTIKYNQASLQLWETRYTGITTNGGDGANDLQIDSNFNVFVTGRSMKPNTNYDAVTIKYNQPIGISSNGHEFPTEFRVFQNYPNPFNGTTVINYELPFKSKIQLEVYNSIGKSVKTLVNNQQNPGYYSIILNAENLSSGVYFYRLTANGNLIETKKLIIIK